MSDFLTYDYTVRVSLQPTLTTVSLDYIRKVAIVCLAKDGTPQTIQVLENASKQQIEANTQNLEISKLIEAGIPSVTLIILPTSAAGIASAKSEIQARLNKEFTVLIASGITGSTSEITDSARLNGNVIGKAFQDSGIQEAKELALTDCAFIDNDQSLGGMYYAFGRLLASSKWSNQQLITAPQAASTVTVADVGTARNYKEERLSFYLDDTKLGRNLGFFVAGGASIVDRYVRAEVARKIQETGVQYISREQPINSEDIRDSLTLEMRAKVFTPYEDQNLLIKGQSTINIKESSTEIFDADGDFSMVLPVALWGLNINLKG